MFGTQVYQLQKQNSAFDLIESVLRVEYDLHKLFGKGVDVEKERVWLFGYKWLTLYYELLSEGEILYSDFYRKNHDRFLVCLRGLLAMRAEERWTPRECVEFWEPRNRLLVPQIADEDTSDAASATASDAASATASDATSAESAASATASVVSTLPPAAPRRLVLTGSRDSVGRNKTRRNRHNSIRSPANGSLDLPAKD